MLDASQDTYSQQYVWYLKLEIEELKTKNAIVKYHIQSLANLLVQIQMDSERLPELSAEIDRLRTLVARDLSSGWVQS